MVLLNPFEASVATNAHIRGNLVKLALLSTLPHFLPVSSFIPAHWLHSELPWTINACLLFEAIPVGTIVELDRCPVRLRQFDHARQSHGLLEPTVELDMHATSCWALLQLTINIVRLLVQLLEELLRELNVLLLVASTEEVAMCHVSPMFIIIITSVIRF